MSKKPGLGLLDIAPKSEQIQIGEQALQVFGVSVAGIVALLDRFPIIGTWVAGGGSVKPSEIATVAPEAIAAIIAAGCNQVGNPDAEAVAGSFPVETQLDILEAIGRLTFSSGFGPFVTRIVGIGNLAVALSGNYGKATDTKSPQPSSNSQPSGPESTQSGT